ncbi:hypothetical protein [Streptomyces kebangsaanensis]|uniref:hypothetical protein n=1 Tax=Streptomyces kebangsaanensis TaxID=864058 RepID=UPI00093EE86B|nr:hypothetical protein [Streptomyces kebangsaanensis]
MNTLKGLGVCAVLAGMTFAMTRLGTFDLLVLCITVTVVVMSTAAYLGSMRRRRRDRRVANGRVRSKHVASG